MAKMMLLRTVCATLVLASTAVLTGCLERYGDGPVAITRNGDDLLIAACIDLDVREIYGEVRTDEGWIPFIDLQGEALMPSGTIIQTDTVVEGLEGSFDRFNLEILTGLAIKFEGTGPGQSMTSTFEGNGVIEVPQGSWLHTDGQISEAPC